MIFYAIERRRNRGLLKNVFRAPTMFRTQGAALKVAIAGEVVVPVRVELIFNKPWKRKK